ncbi:hypothetical protein KY342_06995 [Candidatus Woesearchaeota archaeon]|nr:hypothetical protein [Candidatus Woesearchaeota archaeon]
MGEEHSSVVFLVSSAKKVAEDERDITKFISEEEKRRILERHPASEIEEEDIILKNYFLNPYNQISYSELVRIFENERVIARKKRIVKNFDEFCDRIAKESVHRYAPAVVYNFLKRYTLFSPDRLCDQIEKEHGKVNTINKLVVTKDGNLAEFNYYYDKEYLEGKKEQIRRDLCKTTEYIIREIFEFANATDIKIKEKFCVRRAVTDILNNEYGKLSLSVKLNPWKGVTLKGPKGSLNLPFNLLYDKNLEYETIDLAEAEKNRIVKFQFEDNFILDRITCEKLGIGNIVAKEFWQEEHIFEKGIIYGENRCSYHVNWRHKLNMLKRGILTGIILGGVGPLVGHYLGYPVSGYIALAANTLFLGLIGKMLDKESEIKNQQLSIEELSQARALAEESEARLREHAIYNKNISEKYRGSLLDNLLYNAGLHYTRYIRLVEEGNNFDARKEFVLVREQLDHYIKVASETSEEGKIWVPSLELLLTTT